MRGFRLATSTPDHRPERSLVRFVRWFRVRGTGQGAAHDGHRRPRLPRAGPPLEAPRGGAARRAGRLHGRHVLRPLLAVERAAGPVGLRLVVARCGAAGDRPAVRRGQRARAALPPGDHRPGDGDADRRCTRAGSGRRSAPARRRNEHITGAGLAAQGGPQRPARRVRRRHPPAARRRGGQPRRARHRRPRPGVDAAGGAAAAHRRRGQPGDRRLGRVVGRRPRHRAAAARRPAEDDRRLPQRRRPRAARAAGAPVLGRTTTRRRSTSRTTSGAATSSRPTSTGTSTTSTLFDEASKHVPREAMQGPVLVSADPGSTSAWLQDLVELGFDEIYLHHVGQEQRALARRRSASRCCRSSTSRAKVRRGVRITDTTDLWWKTAVVYCLDVETFLDSDGDGTGDLQGLAQRIDHLADARRHLPVADAGLPDARPRRRLRHHRLLRRRPAARQPRRLRRGGPHRQGPRHAGHRRPRRQPHLRPAPVVPERPRAAATRRSATSTSGATSRRPSSRRSSSPTRRTASGSTTSRPASTTCTSSTSTSPTSTSPTRGSATRSRRSWASGSSWGCRASASTPSRSSWRPTASTTPTRSSPTRTRYLRDLRSFLGRRSGDGILLGEVNLPHEQQQTFFGGTDGDELTMQFDFIAMQKLYLSLARAGRRAAG